MTTICKIELILCIKTMDGDPKFFSTDPDPAQLEKIRYRIMLEFVRSGLYFVQDENNLINLLLQLGSGSGSGRPKINGSRFSSLE